MTKAVDTCPKCGSHLILKDGQFGEFWTCPRFPKCRYTKPDSDDVKLYQKPNPYCKKCNHTGLLPHPTIKYAWLDCECKVNIPKGFYQDILPQDFDFTMSDTFRAYSYQYCNWLDPHGTQTIDNRTSEKVELKPTELRPISEDIVNIAQQALALASQERQKRQQLEVDVKGLKQGFHTHTDKKKEKSKYD